MAVPNTNTFTLIDVNNEINQDSDSLNQCFLDSYAGGFDPLYVGGKDRLSNFRNYRHVLDVTPPTVPTGLSATKICQTTFGLSWNASTDDNFVQGYKIFKNDVLYVTTANVTTYNISGQTAGLTNAWKVSCFDAALNESAKSLPLSVTQGVNVSIFYINLTGQIDGDTACAQTANVVVYKTGTPNIPSNGDKIYTTSCGITLMDGNYDYYSNESFSFTISYDGVIGAVTGCP